MFSKFPQLLFFLHFLVILTTTTTTHAEIRYESIGSFVRPFTPFPCNEFGFSNLGRLELNLTNIKISSHVPIDYLDYWLSQLGFFLTTRNAWLNILQQIEHAEIKCPLHSHLVKIIFTFDSLPKNQSYINHFSTVNDSYQYTLFLVNCYSEINVSMRIASAMYNLEGESGRRDYLSVGQTVLPMLYFDLALTYFVLGCIWLLILWKERLTAFRIHFFMLALVFLEAFNSLCLADHKLHIKRNGSDIDWIFVVFMFSFSKDAVLFMLIVMIGTGWSFLKPFLKEKEMFVLIVVVSFQLITNMAHILLEGDGPYSMGWVFCKRMFLTVDTVCCCLVLFPIVWSIKNIREKPVVNLKQLALFREYFVMLICYIFVTRVVVYVLELEVFTSFRYQWATVVVDKLGTLLFYIFTGYKFKPKAHYPYLGRGRVAME